jgi:hypothetical protein
MPHPMVDSRPMRFAMLRLAMLTILALAGGSGVSGCQSQADSQAAAPPAGTRPGADSVADSSAAWAPRPILVEPDSTAIRAKLAAAAARADTVRADSARAAAADSTAADSTAHLGAKAAAPKKAPRKPAAPRQRYALSAADSALWPVKLPVPLPGSLLPEHRIVAFYGNTKSTRMGILGQIPPSEMLPKLERTATDWAKAEPGRKVLPALHLIVTVAQGKPGGDGAYRLRHSDAVIEQVMSWAEERGWIVFLDVQTGWSSVPAELPRLVKYLERPYVHLAIDPEFAMKNGGVPGRRMGTLDAADVNHAVRLLTEIVDRKKLPPKILVVHRFTERMLTNRQQITRDPRVQVVIDMDGWGAPPHKKSAYKWFVVQQPVQYAGFKLFYKNDKPMMTPAEVLGLWPAPVYIQYQ